MGTDDIVTRLREQTQLAEWDSDCLHPMLTLGREAADEIKNLRADIERVNERVRDLSTQCDQLRAAAA